MEFIATSFADSTGFKDWLSPTLSISYYDDINDIFVDLPNVTMKDYTQGKYWYIFREYDKTRLYQYQIDGWSSTLLSRYVRGNNELDYYNNKQDWWGRVISWLSFMPWSTYRRNACRRSSYWISSGS